MWDSEKGGFFVRVVGRRENSSLDFIASFFFLGGVPHLTREPKRLALLLLLLSHLSLFYRENRGSGVQKLLLLKGFF